jgi:peroxiredoxin
MFGALLPLAAAADIVGQPAPDFALRSMKGSPVRLSEHLGEVVVINFWATWCGPCREEMPSIQELKNKLAGRPFVVLAVNLDEPESRIRKFLTQMKLDFPILLDPDRNVAKGWNARILPATFIVGPDGRVRYSLVGEMDWANEHIVARISELLPSGR